MSYSVQNVGRGRGGWHGEKREEEGDEREREQGRMGPEREGGSRDKGRAVGWGKDREPERPSPTKMPPC